MTARLALRQQREQIALKHAARAGGCTERTIKAHRKQVMAKMQVQTLAELVSLAERIGALVSDNGQTLLAK